MNNQPEALRLADELEWGWNPDSLYCKVATELRRLHEKNTVLHERHHDDNVEYTRVLSQRDALLAILRELADCPSLTNGVDWWIRARRAIKSMEGEKE